MFLIFHFLLFRKNMAGHEEELSRRVCRILDTIGCRHSMIEFRKDAYRQLGMYLTMSDEFQFLSVGSKGEGMTKWNESDHDMLKVYPAILCVDESVSKEDFPKHTAVFVMNMSHPGYCILEFSGIERITDEIIRKSIVPFQKKSVLSSSEFHAGIEAIPMDKEFTMSMTGPALTGEDAYGSSIDVVYGLRSACPTILNKWAHRQRKYDWPPQPVREKILSMTGNLVATGMKGSETKQIEWRLCFNEIELLITESLNDTQHKLYKMLKMIKSDILKVKGLTVTSYMIKNIVFWLSENYPQSVFRTESLFSWIMKSLRLLKRAVKLNYLPYYMIPERNLLKEKIVESDRLGLVVHLNSLVEKGPLVLLECKAVWSLAHLTSRELAVKQQKIENADRAVLYYWIYGAALKLDGMSESEMAEDEQYKQLGKAMLYHMGESEDLI